MVATQTITEEIAELKHDRRAILLAHHYQEAEIQEMADVVGDSLELARKALELRGRCDCVLWRLVHGGDGEDAEPGTNRGGS